MIEHLNGRPYIVTAIANVAHVVTKLPLFSMIKLMHDLYIIIDISSSLIKIAMTTDLFGLSRDSFVAIVCFI